MEGDAPTVIANAEGGRTTPSVVAFTKTGERLVGQCVEVLCEGPSKTNSARLMGRTRTNKIVVFEGNEKLIGQLVDVQVRQANGFSLYGTPVQSNEIAG